MYLLSTLAGDGIAEDAARLKVECEVIQNSA